jgi:hypothetical protein
MVRVLRPDGCFLFQFNGASAATMNLRGRLAWGMVDLLWSAGLVSLSHSVAERFGFDPATAGKSWRGAAISASKIAIFCDAAGARVLEITGAATPMAWCCGSKIGIVG